MWTNEELTQLFPQLIPMEKDGVVYLDSAATSLKLKAAADAQHHFDLNSASNVHRGAHRLSGAATQAYEDARTAAAEYLNCDSSQIIFTKGTTDALNLVANHYSQILTANDAILLTEMEHHANILPWQEVSKETGAKLIFASVNKKGELNSTEIETLIKNNNVKVFSLCHVSNTLGTVNPVEELSKICRDNNCELVVDGAQSVTILKPDLSKMDTDFYTFSLHKIFGPFGVGVLYAKNVSKTNLYQRGGGIISCVSFETAEFIDGPQKFETGTPNISGVVASKVIFDFLKTLNFAEIQRKEKELLDLATEGLSKIVGFELIGQSESKVNILSFNFKGVHPNDLCELLDEQGLALRAGHHCTQPLLQKMGIAGCARASFSIYNTKDDVTKLIKSVKKTLEVLR